VQFLTALNRPVHIINLDPANGSRLPYPCALSISSLITLEEAMDQYSLGPNGAMLYCMEYLEANFDWLVEGLEKLKEETGGDYFVFDVAGQVSWFPCRGKRIVLLILMTFYWLVRSS
jgi:hypothetical protein